MPYKKFLTAISILLCAISCFGQETVEKSDRLSDNITEKYTVLKDSQQVKNGLYQAFFKRKYLLAHGVYTMGKKTGRWHFYNQAGKLMQLYDYSADSLVYEAKQIQGTNIHYVVDETLADSDRVTKPVKAGGRYFGYLPYLALYKTPFNPYQYNIYGGQAVIELLISPLGRLAGYKVHAVCPMMDFDQTIEMDINLLKEEDRQFMPATLNYKPILCRILVRCVITDDGGLAFAYGNEY
jgi:hypothetical protein